MSISSETSFWLSRSTMWFIIWDTVVFLDFLFFFRIPNGMTLRLCSEFLSAKTNLTGLLNVRPISATVNRNGTCVEYTPRLSGRCDTDVDSNNKPFKMNILWIEFVRIFVNNGGGEFSCHTDLVQKRNNKQDGRTRTVY